MGVYPKAAPSQPQQATLGLQLGFSQTSSHFGLGHSGLVHFQSHLGSSQTASHSGLGAFIRSLTWQWVTQCGCLHIVTHFGQSSASQALSGHLIYFMASYLAIRLFTFNVANGVLWLLATGMAQRGFTDWLTYGRTFRVVALPGALRMALTFTNVRGG